jgi:hypothetical protein
MTGHHDHHSPLDAGFQRLRGPQSTTTRPTTCRSSPKRPPARTPNPPMTSAAQAPDRLSASYQDERRRAAATRCPADMAALVQSLK